jgi:hypothetical protein
MCAEFRIFGIPFVEVISDQKMNVSFETTLVYPNMSLFTLRVTQPSFHYSIITPLSSILRRTFWLRGLNHAHFRVIAKKGVKVLYNFVPELFPASVRRGLLVELPFSALLRPTLPPSFPRPKHMKVHVIIMFIRRVSSKGEHPSVQGACRPQ